MQEYLEGNSEMYAHQEDDHLIRVRLQSLLVMWIITRINSTAKNNNKKQINVIESLLYYKVFLIIWQDLIPL
jgi:hypothetical protein